MSGDHAASFDQEVPESQQDGGDYIGTYAYEERADIEVEDLNEWERQHFGIEPDSDSDVWSQYVPLCDGRHPSID